MTDQICLSHLQFRWALLILLPVLMLVFIVYSPGLSGAFAFDDETNILRNSHLQIKKLNSASLKQAALSGQSGPLKRPLSMMSFALNYYQIKSLDPYWFKLTNVFIHLLNGVALFVFAYHVLKAHHLRFTPKRQANYLPWISLVIASFWLLHPLCLTSVLYVVQRMTSLSALFVFTGLIFYLYGRIKILQGEAWGITNIVIGYLVFLPLATLSKENGMLLPLFMLVLEITLFNFATVTLSAKRFLICFFAVTVALPAVIALAYVISHPDYIIMGYVLRDFSLLERLLTEPRVLWFYLQMILFPLPQSMGFFHDDIPVSRSLFNPVTTFPAIFLLLVLALTALAARKRYPILALGILFFLSGHLLESTVIALEMTYEHRNYLPMAGIILSLTYYLLHPLWRDFKLRTMGVSLLIGLLAVTTASRAGQWGNPFLLINTEIKNHPDSARAQAEMGAFYGELANDNKLDPNFINNYVQLMQQHFIQSAELDKKNLSALIGLIYYSAKLNVNIERAWIEDLLWQLENVRFAPTNIEKLYLLESCIEENGCILLTQEIKKILEAALRNPTVDGKTKSNLLTLFGLYLANVENDDQKALKLLQDAIALTPTNPGYRANLISFFISRKQFVAARNEIALARKLDIYGAYTQLFNEQEEMLN